MLCCIFRLSLEQSHGQNILLYLAHGQQVHNCIPVGHFNSIKGTWPRINQSQCLFFVESKKVQVCNKSYCIPSRLVSHCAFLFHYTRWWNGDFIWSWWYYHKYWTNWWRMVERCCSWWLCWIISSKLCGNYLLKEMTPSWSFSTRFWFNEIIDC